MTARRQPRRLPRRLNHVAQRHAARGELERELLAGLDSGAAIPVTPEYWAAKRRELRERVQRRKKA